MADLSEIAGYPLKLDRKTAAVSFGPEMRMPLYSTRELDALRPVLLDSNVTGQEVAYWMYRNCGQPDDTEMREEHALRYDLTVFPGVMLGPEYMKTFGHYHPLIPGQDLAYPEVYEILSGEALYVMQRVDDFTVSPDEMTIEDVIMVRASAGQKIIMPPGYGHVTINPLAEPLVMSNWVSDRFSSFYGSVEDARGFAWYVVNSGGEPSYLENKNYAQGVPNVHWAEVREVPELGIVSDRPLYQLGIEAPEALEFLNDPAGYEDLIWSNVVVQ